MSKLPKYINCNNEEVEHCEFYMSKHCPATCAYSRYLGSDVVRDEKFLENLEKLAMFLEEMDD